MKQLITKHKDFVTGGCLGWIALFWAPVLAVSPAASDPITDQIEYILDVLPYLWLLIPAFLIATLILSAILTYLSIKNVGKSEHRPVYAILLVIAPASLLGSFLITVKYVNAFVL